MRHDDDLLWPLTFFGGNHRSDADLAPVFTGVFIGVEITGVKGAGVCRVAHLGKLLFQVVCGQ
ncbi:hypothetical protein D3C72_2233210 [compost metagenome]